MCTNEKLECHRMRSIHHLKAHKASILSDLYPEIYPSVLNTFYHISIIQ